VEVSSAHMTVEKLRVTVFMCIEQCAIRVAVIMSNVTFCCMLYMYKLWATKIVLEQPLVV